MGRAILNGWLHEGTAETSVTVVEPTFKSNSNPFNGLKEVTVFTNPDDLPNSFQPEIIVFAVKPQQMVDTLPSYVRFATGDPIFVSIAGGTKIAFLEKYFGQSASIVRAMPNLPAAVRCGISVMCPNSNVLSEQLDTCSTLLSAVGDVSVIRNEDLLDVVTAISGCGPAYVFLLIECLAEVGEAAGLPRELAEKLALITVSGSG